MKIIFKLLVMVSTMILLSGCGGSGNDVPASGQIEHDADNTSSTTTGGTTTGGTTTGGTTTGGTTTGGTTTGGTTTGGTTSVEIFKTKPKFAIRSISADDKIKFSDGTHIPAKKDEIIIYLNFGITTDQFDVLSKKITEAGGEIIGTNPKLLMLQVKFSDPKSAKDSLISLDGVRDIGYHVFRSMSFVSNEEGYINSINNSHVVTPRIRSLRSRGITHTNWWEKAINYVAIEDLTSDANTTKEIIENLRNKIKIGIADSGIKKDQKLMDESRLSRYDSSANVIHDDDTPWNDHGRAVTAFVAGKSTTAKGVNPYSPINFIDFGKYINPPKEEWYLYQDNNYSIPMWESGVEAAIEKGDIVNVSSGMECSMFSYDCDNEKLAEQADKGMAQILWFNNLHNDLTKKALIVTSAGNDGESLIYNEKYVKFNELREDYQKLVTAVPTKYKDKITKWTKVGGGLFDTKEKCEEGIDLGTCVEVYCDIYPLLKQCKINRPGYKNYNTERSGIERELWKNFTIVVGATKENGGNYTDTEFSRMGSNVDILAPGEDVSAWSTKSTIYGGKNNKGTSFSSPIVAGAASVIKGIEPSLTAPEIKRLIISGASSVKTKYMPKLQLNMKQSVNNALMFRNIELVKMDIDTFSYGNNINDANTSFDIPGKLGINALDLMFLIDVSGSFYDDIETLKTKAKSLMEDIENNVSDTNFAVAKFSDFPQYPYGDPDVDTPYELAQSFTSNNEDVKKAIDNLNNPLLNGSDGPESQLQALYRSTTDGNVGWRDGSSKVIVLATDAVFHDSKTDAAYPGASSDETIKELNKKNIKVIGLDSGNTGEDLKNIVHSTGGELFPLSSDSSGLSSAVLSGLKNMNTEEELEFELVAGNSLIKKIEVQINDEYETIEIEEGKSIYKTKTKTKAGDHIKVLATIEAPSTLLIGSYAKTLIHALKLKIGGGDALIWVKRNGSIIKRLHAPILIKDGE